MTLKPTYLSRSRTSTSSGDAGRSAHGDDTVHQTAVGPQPVEQLAEGEALEQEQRDAKGEGEEHEAAGQ